MGRRGSSKAGRPREKDRERYGDGRPKPVGPHVTVLQRRRQMMGDDTLDLSQASDPLDFAHVKGFLSLARYMTADSYFRLYHRAEIGPPRLALGSMRETTPSVEVRLGSFSTMTHKDVVTIWDTVFNVTGPPTEARSAAALVQWKQVQSAMTAEERAELHAVIVCRSWPQWVVFRARGKPVPETWDRKRQLLESGLDKVRRVLRPTRKRVLAADALPAPVAQTEVIARDFVVGDEAFFVEDGRRYRVVILSDRTEDLGAPTRAVEFLDGEVGEFDVLEKLLVLAEG